MKRDILKFNQDITPIVYSSCKYGLHGYGKENYKKKLSMLISADIHGCVDRLEEAICYLNEIPCLDCAIHLGDMQPSNFSENDGKWFTETLQQAKKPFYAVAGNHDGGNSVKGNISATRQEVFEKFFAPIKNVMNLPTLNKTYYRVDFAAYKIVLIVLDNYIMPETKDDNGDFIFHRGYETYDQAQLNWLVETLKSVPQDYHLMIANHSFTEPCKEVDCVWSQPNAKIAEGKFMYGKQDVLTRIIDAWMYGKGIEFAVEPEKIYSSLPILHVKADFTNRKEGSFIGYFIGHTHQDIYGRCVNYPKQSVFVFASSANDLWQNANCDLPRAYGTKQEDLLTVCSIDTEERKVKLVRIGSNITTELTNRTSFVVGY